MKLQEGQCPPDENLRPIKVGGQATALETAKSGNGARVRGDLEVTGDLEVIGEVKHINSTDLTIDDAGSISLDVTSGGTTTGLLFKNAGTLIGDLTVHHSATYLSLYENGGASTDDNFDIAVAVNGATTMQTQDSAGTDANLTLDADGILILNSVLGRFKAKRAGTEFSVTNSAYAGMILGYTVDGINQTPATYTLTVSAAIVASGTHHVSFVAPPSGAVEIEVQINYDAGSYAPILLLNLSDNATLLLNGLADYLSQQIHEPARGANDQNIIHKWVVTGLTAGDSYKWYLVAAVNSTTGTPKLQWGGDSGGENPVFIMKATALPTATTDYAIYS